MLSNLRGPIQVTNNIDPNIVMATSVIHYL